MFRTTILRVFQIFVTNIKIKISQKSKKSREEDEYSQIRRNPRHPEVGRAKGPDFSRVKAKVGSKNENFHRRREPNKVKIFNDKDYMKAVKVTRFSLSSDISYINKLFVPIL